MRRKTLISLGLLASAMLASGTLSSAQETSDTVTQPRADTSAEQNVAASQSSQPKPKSFAGRLLATHNAERKVMRVAPLRWSKKLEADARIWARELARTNVMRHADQSTTNDAGENLWAGPIGYHGPEDMVELFIAEKQYFRAGNFPNVSTTGNWRDVGHYTQIIWPQTEQVGCALSQGTSFEFLVCRYYPAGNWRKRPVGYPTMPETDQPPASQTRQPDG